MVFWGTWGWNFRVKRALTVLSLNLLGPKAQNHLLVRDSAQVNLLRQGGGPKDGFLSQDRVQEGGRGGAGWLLTLVTGQVWFVPELGRILDELDIALALVHRGL